MERGTAVIRYCGITNVARGADINNEHGFVQRSFQREKYPGLDAGRHRLTVSLSLEPGY